MKSPHIKLFCCHILAINIIIFMEIYGESCKFMVGYNKNTKHTKEETENEKNTYDIDVLLDAGRV